ncbi:Hydroxyproline-rich glycoprotein family protein [Musa troglodytarum]|uniref:Hydroxyproline-rich glycoprotein family protein n=1 Tax=Musa troglodytarum TaxID=320322 RepID=A0A9E7FTE2_9LILI|nr:Hydroxyproline-rich glycoprotein family protein [Musa troglodytarum]
MAVDSSLPPSSRALSLISVVVLVSTADLAVSLIPPSSSPSPSPVPGGPLRSSSAHSPPSPSPSPSPKNRLEVPSPAPTPSATPSPAPVPSHEEIQSGEVADQAGRDGEGRGMSGGKKAGLAMGVVLGVAVLAGGAVMYKKRRDNIRRSRYGYATRMEML